MKYRPHHNNKGLRQIKRGKTRIQVREMARRLGIPYSGNKRSTKLNAEQISKCEKLDLDRGVFMDYYSGLDGCLVIGTPAFAPIVIKDE